MSDLEMIHPAVAALKMAVELRPESWEFQFRLGMAQGVINNVREARKSIGAAEKLAPNNPEVTLANVAPALAAHPPNRRRIAI